MASLPCFKAYDVRGKVPEQLSPALARDIGRAFVDVTGAKKVVVGRDVRDSSPALCDALSQGLRAQGADVVDIGLCGTEMVYFGAFALEDEGVDGGIMVTASHNPLGDNGKKFVGKSARPVTRGSGLEAIGSRCATSTFAPPAATPGTVEQRDIRGAYVAHLLSYVDTDALRPLKILVNGGHGCAAVALDALEPHLPFTLEKIHHAPDGTFPAGIPNPLLEENRGPTISAVKRSGADFGLAWDGDFDRCFFFDETGAFVEGYYMVGLFATALLARQPGGRIVHDPRLVWNTIDLVEKAGGIPVQSKTGHAFIKERMRKEDAIYGGEMSAHHYFRDFAYCDSGMIPWLLLSAQLSRTNQKLSSLIAERQALFPASGEINRRVDDPDAAIEKVRTAFLAEEPGVDETDGVSLTFARWRLNLRKSNTEPVLRLNVESRGDASLMREKTAAVLRLIDTD